MAIPASVIPAGNSYSVNLAGPGSATAAVLQSPQQPPESQILTVTAAAAAALLKPYDVDVRQHLTGDDAGTQKYRDFLTRAGAKASAFSPAPSDGIPGEGFWKTTLAVVQAMARENGVDEDSPSRDFWWLPRADKKVEWDCLLVALYDQRGDHRGEALASVLEFPAEQINAPDLWLVATEEDATLVMEAWIGLGAGAVAVISPTGVAWTSRSASFGNARGFRTFDTVVESGSVLGHRPLTEFTFGCFAGGVVAGLIEELLGDNVFDKGIVRVERSELEARPLHIGKAAGQGSAAARASAVETPERLLHKSGDLTGRVRAMGLADQPGGAPKPWGSKGR